MGLHCEPSNVVRYSSISQGMPNLCNMVDLLANRMNDYLGLSIILNQKEGYSLRKIDQNEFHFGAEFNKPLFL